MSGIVYFFIAAIALIVGYYVYGNIVEKIFGADANRATPCKTKADGVDYIEMDPKKIWLIQILNIAGLGPIFGPILGALYGPSALVWIVIGSIFGGAVHDYMSGFLSMRYGGNNVPNIVGYNLGKVFKHFMRYFSVLLLLLVGVVFVAAPAGLLAKITPDWMNQNVWVIIIFAYYFLATILPIDKIIGKIYPIFGALLIIMAVGIISMLIIKGYDFYPAAEWTNQHPNDLPLWPLMFITIACGAISGFHATQSPMMARCLGNEKLAKPVFYGGMIAEGVIALVWATVGMTFYATPELLAAAGGPAAVVHETSIALMGTVGGLFAIVGVIILPITSGDTAFRATRLTIAEIFNNFSQREYLKRLYIAVPLFALGIVISQINFDILWRYFGWANQTLATVVLWTGAAWLYKRDKFHWIATLPATFMTAVIITYICYEPNMGFGIDISISEYIGIAAAVASLIAFLAIGKKPVEEKYKEEQRA